MHSATPSESATTDANSETVPLAPTRMPPSVALAKIVLLINFLVGLVMAFQASIQLKQLGANILVANLIGISVTRELGPLMTAIVVAGRSGAAFAAEASDDNSAIIRSARRCVTATPRDRAGVPRVRAAT